MADFMMVQIHSLQENVIIDTVRGYESCLCVGEGDRRGYCGGVVEPISLLLENAVIKGRW